MSALSGLRAAMAADDSSALRAGDDLDEIGVGEQRRIFQHGCGDHVSTSRASVRTMYLGTQSSDLMPSARTARTRGDLILRQTVQRLDRDARRCSRSSRPQIGHQARDLARQFGAHIVVGVVGETAIGVRPALRIGRDGAARGDGAVRGEIVEHIGARIVTAGQFVLRGLGALFQDAQNLLARQCPRQIAWQSEFCAFAGIVPPLSRRRVWAAAL